MVLKVGGVGGAPRLHCLRPLITQNPRARLTTEISENPASSKKPVTSSGDRNRANRKNLPFVFSFRYFRATSPPRFNEPASKGHVTYPYLLYCQ